MKTRAAAWAVALAIGTGGAAAECLSGAQAESIVAHYFSRQPVDFPTNLVSEKDCACSRTRVAAALQDRLGPPIGYKVGLTSPDTRRFFEYDQPIWGRFYTGMLLPNGSEVDTRYGARPVIEADLLVRVSSTAINRARTPLEALAAIDQVLPFIELRDLLADEPGRMTGAAICAFNSGVRLGVVGEPVPVPQSTAARKALLKDLGDMRIYFGGGMGVTMSVGKGTDVMGHPLHAMLWLVRALAADGQSLQAGQYVSLGSFSPMLPPRPGTMVTALYAGLPGALPVWVRFKPAAE